MREGLTLGRERQSVKTWEVASFGSFLWELAACSLVLVLDPLIVEEGGWGVKVELLGP